MARPCTICTHEKRAEIDQALVTGTSYRNVSVQYGISVGAIQRHKKDHIVDDLANSPRAQTIARSDNLLDQLQALKDKALDILETAESAKALPVALQAIREVRSVIELYAKLAGKLQESTVNVILSPEWLQLRAIILQIIEPYPEAKGRLLEAFNRVDVTS